MDDKAQQLTAKVVTPEEYGRKRAEIQAAKAFLEQLENDNEAGRAKYESELLQKVREGEEARQRLLELGRYHDPRVRGPLAIEAAPSTARIEEVPVTSPQPSSTTTLASGQKSFQVYPPPGIPATQPITMHPFYNAFLQSSLPRENQSYSGPLQYPRAPQTHNPHVPPSQPMRVQHQPGILPTANYKQQAEAPQKPAVQYQRPSVTRQARPSSTQVPIQPQAQTAGARGSFVSQVQVNGTGNTSQDSQRPVHYNPTGVHSAGTSSLIGALGPQTSQSNQPSAPPPLVASTLSSTVPENMPKPPQVAHAPTSAPTSASDSWSQGSAASLPGSELEERKLRILTFRASILEWARGSQPNTYTEFFKIRVYKSLNSALYITSLHKGREITEEQSEFFERLWLMAGLPLDTIPFKRGSTNGLPASDTITAGQTPPRAMAAPTAQGARATSHSRVSPQTPRQQTLVDPVTGIWRSPADADKRRLARDVIHALGKRKQSSISHTSPNENPAKRQALEPPSTSGSAHPISEPVIRTSTTSMTTLTMLPTPLVTSQQTERQPPEVASKPAELSNGLQQPTPLEPSAQFIEPPPPLTIVTPPAIPHSRTESTPLPNNNLGPSNTPGSQALLTSVSSIENGDAEGTSKQVVVGSLPSEEPTTTPSQILPTSSPVRATPVAPLRQPGEAFPATTVAQLPIAVPNTDVVHHEILAPPSIPQSDEVDNQPRSLPKSVAAPFDSPASSQVPSSSQAVQSELDISLSNPNDAPTARVWSSSFDISQEASTSKAREPLFLPSPSPSSSPLPSKNKGESSVYVLVPPPPEYLIRARKRQWMKDELNSQKDSTRTSSVVSTSKPSRSLEDFSLPRESEHDRIDPHEQEAIQLSCSRLQPVPCRWGECDIILNSVDALIHHLNREHKPAGISFICRWTQCGRQCRFHEKHLERHATMTLQCGYQGCKESYRSSSQLLKHFRAKHLNGMLQAQAKPFHHECQPPVPLPNTIVPSYLIVTTPVLPTSISPEEHSTLGPWVLENVVGFDGHRPRRRKANGYGEENNAYDFLNTRSTRYSWNESKPVDMNFDDLDSEEISKECDQGLTFFGMEDTGVAVPSDEGISPSPSFSSPPKIKDEDVNAETEGLDWQTTNTEPTDEEEMVQKSLLDSE